MLRSCYGRGEKTRVFDDTKKKLLWDKIPKIPLVKTSGQSGRSGRFSKMLRSCYGRKRCRVFNEIVWAGSCQQKK